MEFARVFSLNLFPQVESLVSFFTDAYNHS